MIRERDCQGLNGGPSSCFHRPSLSSPDHVLLNRTSNLSYRCLAWEKKVQGPVGSIPASERRARNEPNERMNEWTHGRTDRCFFGLRPAPRNEAVTTHPSHPGAFLGFLGSGARAWDSRPEALKRPQAGLENQATGRSARRVLVQTVR